MKNWYKYTLVLLMGLWVLSASAQRLAYDVDFVMDFDNREANHPYETTGTLFGIRLTPTIGMQMDDSIGGLHRLMAGVTYLQPFGADWKSARVLPTVYYRYEVKGFGINFGFVPYSMLINPLPDYLRSDSLAFADPNIRGALFQYQSKWGHAEILADWRGMMTDTVREAFRIVGGGKFHYQWFYAGGFAQLNHLSHSEKVLGVVDDIIVNPLFGANLTQMTPLDSLAIQAGYIFSWERDRNADDSRLLHGLHLDATIRWRFIELRNEFYFGDNQMPFYGTYGSLSNQGDPRYQSRIYNRTDLRLYMVRLPFVTAYAGWNLLYLQDYGISNQQQIVCRFNMEECIRFSRLSREDKRAAWKRGVMLRAF